jgi:hypothetical protein
MMDTSRSSLIKAGQAASLKCHAVAEKFAAEREQFRALCAAGASCEAIAEATGLGETHIRRKARTLGLPIPEITRPHAKHGLKPTQKLGKRKPQEQRNA